MQGEIWKDIPNYEGFYQVSNMGRVKSLERVVKRRGLLPSKIKSLCFDNYGYLLVVLYKDAKGWTTTVHRLVCDAFIENADNKPCVNHKNGIKTDNSAENLEWVTWSENSLHSCRVLNNVKRGVDSPFNKQVYQYDKFGNLIEKHQSVTLAGIKTSVCDVNISTCCLGKGISAGGFIWSYVELQKEHFIGIKIGKNAKAKRDIAKCDLNGNVIEVFESITEAYESIETGNVNEALSGRCKTAGGYTWKYIT